MKRNNLKDTQDSGFKVPKGYFDSFENAIMSHVSLKEQVSDSGFAVPEGYFDAVEETILNKVSQKESKKVISLVNRKSIVYITSIAATLVLLFTIINRNPDVDINSIETASIESYLSNEDFDTDELASLFSDTEFLDDSFNIISFSEEAIENYVNDNLELNDLYIE